MSRKPGRFLNETDPAVPLFKVLDDFSAERPTHFFLCISFFSLNTPKQFSS